MLVTERLASTDLLHPGAEEKLRAAILSPGTTISPGMTEMRHFPRYSVQNVLVDLACFRCKSSIINGDKSAYYR